MSGLIGVSASVNARFSAFTECLANLWKPRDTEVVIEPGIDIGANRNKIVRRALDHGRQWVFFVDDDMVFREHHLTKLLNHEQPVVASLYLNRKPPFYPVAYNNFTLENGKPVWKPVVLDGAPDSGLAEIVAAGTGGMLIRTEVFRAIDYDTWFTSVSAAGEDLAFCQRVTAAGFPIYLDLGAPMGHISTYEVWPRFQKGWSGSVELTDNDAFPVALGD